MNQEINTAPRGRNLYLDLFRVVLAFLVICLHFTEERTTAGPLFRMAMPTFFMISGYFLSADDNEKELLKAKRFIKSSLKYLVVGFAIYIVFDFCMTLAHKESFGSFFKGLFVDNFFKTVIIYNQPITSGYHLWFLTALAIVACVHYLLVRFQKTKWYYAIIPVCVFAFFFFGGYLEIMEGDGISIYYTRNALFTGLPMTAIGYCLSKWKFLRARSYLKWIYLVLGVAAFCLQMLEYKINFFEYYISSIFSAAFLLLFLADLRSPSANWYYKYVGKEMPYYIYVLHLAVGFVLEELTPLRAWALVPCIFLLSFAIYEAGYLLSVLIKHLIQQRRHKKETQTENAE